MIAFQDTLHKSIFALIHGKALDHGIMPNAISNSLILGKLGEMLLLAAAVKSRW